MKYEKILTVDIDDKIRVKVKYNDSGTTYCYLILEYIKTGVYHSFIYEYESECLYKIDHITDNVVIMRLEMSDYIHIENSKKPLYKFIGKDYEGYNCYALDSCNIFNIMSITEYQWDKIKEEIQNIRTEMILY